MTNDLITWRQEPAKPAESMFDILKDDNETQAHAAHIAAVEQEKERIAAEAAARLDELSDSELMEKWQQTTAAEKAKTLSARQEEAARQFVVEAPEFVLSPRNQERMDQYFQAAKMDATNPDHFHKAYRALASRGLVQIDESRRPRVPRQQLNEDDLYSLPIEQLRDLANQSRRR